MTIAQIPIATTTEIGWLPSKPDTCKLCPLYRAGQGFMQAEAGTRPIMLVGESLGSEEADRGRPFVGPAGRALRDFVARAGLDWSDAWVANIVWCRPPLDNLENWKAAIDRCMNQYLDPLIRQVQPKVIIALGGISCRNLTGAYDKILEVRGYPVWSERYQAWIVPTVHPSYIIRGNTHWGTVLIH